MAKKKMEAEPEAPKRAKRYQVLLDADLARKIGAIASALDVTVPDWVNNRLRPIVAQEFPKAIKVLEES